MIFYTNAWNAFKGITRLFVMRYHGDMHVRAIACRGLPVCEFDGQERFATVVGPVLQPDTGHIEGFIVRTPSFFSSQTEFLSSHDIAHWGLVVRIRHREMIGPLEERLRLRELVESGRTVLGQLIVTEQGVAIGRCRDVQFETQSFQLEWIFPKHWGRWRTAIAARDIVEVRRDAIVVKERQPVLAEEASVPVVPRLIEG